MSLYTSSAGSENDGAASLSSVHPQESISQSRQNPDLGSESDDFHKDVAFRHRGWARQREATRAAYRRLDVPVSRRLAFDACGSRAWVFQHPDDPNVFKVAGAYCHDHFCVPCAVERGRRIQQAIAKAMADQKPRLLTLTIRSQGEPLHQLLDKLYRCFSELRRCAFWKAGVEGGAAVCEVTHNQGAGGWHPHLHVVFSGRYLPVVQIREAWHRITGDSYIVDIRLFDSGERAAGYLGKYLSKPVSATAMRVPSLLDELITAMAGRRLINTFGSWRAIQMTDVTSDVDWIPIDSLASLRRRARGGDVRAIEILTLIGAFETCPTTTLTEPAKATGPPPSY